MSTLFIVGVGPMIGSHVARLFATHTFTNFALFARSSTSLTTAKEFILAGAPKASIKTYTADVTDAPGLTSALETAVKEVGVPSVVVYNAARINYGMFGSYAEEDILTDFKIPCLGLYTTAKIMVPHLQAYAKNNPDAHTALFVTSSGIAIQPFAPVFSLSMAKAAQVSLVKLLYEENKGVVHVATVMIDGQVSAEEPLNNPTNAAKKFWEVYGEEKGKWEVEYHLTA